jgi:hypothetical protein
MDYLEATLRPGTISPPPSESSAHRWLERGLRALEHADGPDGEHG